MLKKEIQEFKKSKLVPNIFATKFKNINSYRSLKSTYLESLSGKIAYIKNFSKSKLVKKIQTIYNNIDNKF